MCEEVESTLTKDFQGQAPEEPVMPVYICSNPRNLVKPEAINLNAIALKRKDNLSHRRSQLVPYSVVAKPILPFPQFPLSLMWSPPILHFELNCDRVLNCLRLNNSSARPIYIQIYGLSDETARRGASWCVRPRTRILLAPGMNSFLAVIATPREESPVAEICLGLQLSASHLRDIVVGYFIVPMKVKFMNYKSTSVKEEESKDCIDEGGRGVAPSPVSPVTTYTNK